MKPLNNFLMCVALLMLTASANALEITLNKTQLNLLLKAYFPYQLTMALWQAVVEQRDIQFYPQQQEVSLSLTLLAKGDGSFIQANGKIRGKVVLDSNKQQLQIVKPSIQELHLVKSNLADAKEVMNLFRTTIEKQFSIIVLIDTSEIAKNLMGVQPKSLRVVDNGIAVGI